MARCEPYYMPATLHICVYTLSPYSITSAPPAMLLQVSRLFWSSTSPRSYTSVPSMRSGWPAPVSISTSLYIRYVPSQEGTWQTGCSVREAGSVCVCPFYYSPPLLNALPSSPTRKPFLTSPHFCVFSSSPYFLSPPLSSSISSPTHSLSSSPSSPLPTPLLSFPSLPLPSLPSSSPFPPQVTS